jgi:protein SCO1
MNPIFRCVGLTAVACVLCILGGCGKAPVTTAASGPVATTPTAFKAVDITGADYGRQLALPDVDGAPRSLADFKGKVTVVFFGFTHCPDVCPLTMAELAQVKKDLGKDGERVQGVFVTLDPERDTPVQLKGYVTGFDKSFVALRGTLEQTTAVARDFKVFFAKVPGKTPDSYTLDHTAGSYVFDASGKLRLFTRFASNGGAVSLKADLLKLLTE